MSKDQLSLQNITKNFLPGHQENLEGINNIEEFIYLIRQEINNIIGVIQSNNDFISNYPNASGEMIADAKADKDVAIKRLKEILRSLKILKQKNLINIQQEVDQIIAESEKLIENLT